MTEARYNGVRAAWMNVCISEQRNGEDKEGYAWVSGGSITGELWIQGWRSWIVDA